MILNRINQGLLYIFGRYSQEDDNQVKTILSQDEFKIFDSMMKYDKIHSFRLLNFVRKNSVLKNNKLYWKLALLHDCGKGHTSFFRRIKKVITGDKTLEKHTENGYIKLKDINMELAILCREHHNKPESLEMKEFQKLDDR